MKNVIYITNASTYCDKHIPKSEVQELHWFDWTVKALSNSQGGFWVKRVEDRERETHKQMQDELCVGLKHPS